ncbi:MAG: NADH-ubiquinone oxidoreductase-F iron-sulfur binding region domain-containing protein, partial [Lacipirellulaceae bacterium]
HQSRKGNGDANRASHHDLLESDIEKQVAIHGSNEQAILPILQTLANTSVDPTSNQLNEVSAATRTPPAQVAGIQSFYTMLSGSEGAKIPVRVCDGPVCMALGAADFRKALEAIDRGQERFRICRTSCLGLCDRAPAALVGIHPCGPLSQEELPHSLIVPQRSSFTYSQPLTHEHRVAMARLQPSSEQNPNGGIPKEAYRSLESALSQPSEQVLKEIEDAGLRGCGGAGFPTAQKWRMVAQTGAKQKFVICNADESEPGAFKDRVLMEGDPHLVIEGMALTAYAVGANEGIVYVRGEYEQSATQIERAIEQARQAGWLRNRLGDSEFLFDVHVHRGAGAYICGEETALLESLEGHRGEPRLRPPYPTTQGYLGQPTVVNNVETLCLVPPIVQRGGAWYRNIGHRGTSGTKVLTLSGHIKRAGAFEAPLGLTVREAIDWFGAGMREGSRFKMALTGGAAGTFVPADLLDTPLDYGAIEEGVALGSGVIMVFDESISAVDTLSWVLKFFRNESCGKCTPCREGSSVACNIVDRIAHGNGCSGDFSRLRQLARMLDLTSLCGLGKSIALPIGSALNHFAEDFLVRGAS